MKKVRIGNQTAFSALIPVLPFEYAVDNGFDAFEWFPDKHESGLGWDEGDIDLNTRLRIRETAVSHDISLAVHLSLDADPRRKEKHEIISRDIRFARDIGAALINLHLLDGDGIGLFKEAVMPLIEQTASAGMKLSIENTPFTRPEDFNELFTLLNMETADVSHVGMCLDIGHANLHESTRNDYLGFTDSLAPYVPIIHIHMHENYGDCDSHLPFFKGPAGEDDTGIRGFVERMKKRDFSGSVILEQWPHPPSMLNHARNRLNQLFNLS